MLNHHVILLAPSLSVGSFFILFFSFYHFSYPYSLSFFVSLNDSKILITKFLGGVMTKKEKGLIKFMIFLSLYFGIAGPVSAMHIMEGYLPGGYCIFWDVICLPFLVWGFIKIKNTVDSNRRSITLLAVAGAFIFVISSLKIPSVTGSCSHMTGTGLGAILFGPAPVSILGLIVLIFQALLLAHGGLTTLGANVFSMAITGPFMTYFIYKMGLKLKWNYKFSVFLSCMLGDLFTYCVTAVQLAIAYPAENGGVLASALTFLGVFAPTQLPLAVIEGLISVVIMIALESYALPELRAVGFEK